MGGIITLWKQTFPPSSFCFLLELFKIVEVFVSTFLQFLQFWSEQENPLPFGINLHSYAAWKVLFHCGRRSFSLSSISFRIMRNCGSLHVQLFCNPYSSGLRRRIHCHLAQNFVLTLPGRYYFTVEGGVSVFLLFLFELCGIVDVLMSTFLQFLTVLF